MKIKTKLSLLLTLIIALLLIVLNLFIYSISRSFASNDFFYRLRMRTYAAANVYLEEDEVSNKVFLGFQKVLLEKLPGETIRLYDFKNQPAFIVDSLPSFFPITIIEKTRKEKTYKSKVNGIYTYGIFYPDNQGDFVILASATDKIGDTKLEQLGKGLLTGFLFSIFILFFIGIGMIIYAGI